MEGRLTAIENPERDIRRIARLDRETAREIRYHGDVRPETVRLYEENGRLYGVGYVIKGQGPFYHLAVRVNAHFAAGVRAAEALFQWLTDWFCKADLPEKDPVLRLWVRDTEDAYRAFAESFGFRERDRMLVMQKAAEAGENPEIAAHVRRMTLKDPGEAARYLHAAAEAFDLPPSEAEVRYRLTKGRGRVFGYFEGTDPVSFVTVFPAGGGVFATENIFTLPAYRRKGYAEALLTEVFARYREEGAAAFRLTVYGDDLPAIAFYEKLGYRKAYELSEYGLKQVKT